MSTIVITGGAGFIGVNAAERFAAKGWSVTIFDDLSRKGSNLNLEYIQQKFPDRIRFVRGDVCSREDLSKAFSSDTDAVLHLAAQVAVTTSVTDPTRDFQINALGTFQVLESVRAICPHAALVYASTNKVYGGLEHIGVSEAGNRYVFTDGRPGVDETTPLDFHSPYGCSKGAADQYVRDYSRIYNMRTVVLRQSCIYGTRQMGVEDQGWVAWFLLASMFQKPVTLYGTGKQVRDLLHVDDLVSLYEAAIANIATAAGNIYNVGGGSQNTLSLLEFLAVLKSDLGIDLQYAKSTERPGDQPIFVSDNSKALRELQWKPTVGVHDGIKRLHEWLTQNKESLAHIYAS